MMQVGMLDQGFFPDGLYTAPTDEAMRFDLDMAKSLGYNMLRKHIKVEPDRWYYYADQIGIDRKSTRLNSSHSGEPRMPSSA